MDTITHAPPQRNPYLDARKEWDERYGSLISRANNWRRAAFAALLIALLETGGLIALANTRKRFLKRRRFPSLNLCRYAMATRHGFILK